MEILVGPALPAHVRAKSAQDSGSVQSDGGGAVMGNRVSGSEEDNKTGFYFGADGSDRSSSESSSIGVQSDDEEDTNGVVSDKDGDGEEEDEVQSKPSSGLASLDALEDSLPVKRGLSNYFAGKSKSFGNLSEVSAVKDLKKEENPLNKRRRTLLAMRMNKKSFYSWARNQPTSMPLLALAEEEEEEQSSYEDQQVEGEEKQKYGQFRHSKMFAIGGLERKFRGFQSPSCSCLTDLQEEEEEDDYEEE